MITIKAPDAKLAQEQLDKFAKQIPFATAVTLTNLAKLVQAGEYKVMARRFDRPTRTTMDSIFVRPANKTKLQAVVGLKDQGAGIAANKYLQSAVYGTYRKPKRFEKALMAKGVLKPGQYAVPNKDFLDHNGNVKGSLARRLLKAVDPNKASAPAGKRTRASKYFAGEVDGQDGIWERKRFGKDYGVRPVFIFTDAAPRYSVRVPFFKIAENIIKANFDKEFEKAFERAVSTAR